MEGTVVDGLGGPGARWCRGGATKVQLCFLPWARERWRWVGEPFLAAPTPTIDMSCCCCDDEDKVSSVASRLCRAASKTHPGSFLVRGARAHRCASRCHPM